MHKLSLYDPSYCDKVVAFMAGGFSLTAFAGSIGVCRDTVFAWKRAHEEFEAATQRGIAAAVFFWEKAQITLATTGVGNATACVFGLKNRARDEWRDVQEVHHEVKRTYDLSSISNEDLAELERIVRFARPADGDQGRAMPQEPGSVH